eukprot:1194423-Prorocentrum_minimum.AAC.25
MWQEKEAAAEARVAALDDQIRAAQAKLEARQVALGQSEDTVARCEGQLAALVSVTTTRPTSVTRAHTG